MSLRSTVSLAVVLAVGACASTDKASRKMLDLNHEALAAYEAGKLAHARDLLVQAVSLGKKNGLTKHNTMARTYLDLGAVYLSMNDRDKGLRNLGLALRIQPDIEPTDPIATPAVKKALARSRAEVEKRRGATAVHEKEEREEKAPAPRKHEPAAPPHTVAKASPAPAEKPAAPEKAAPPAEKPAPPAEKAVAAHQAAAPDDEEPDLPANVPQPLYCPVPDEAPPSSEIALRCVPRPGVSFSKIVLFYRSAGSESFTTVPMVKSRKGWYSGMVPANAVVGRTLQYYVEAQLPGKKSTTSNGHSDSPNLLSIREGAARVGQGTLAAAHFKKEGPASTGKEENPLLEAEREREEAESESSDHRRRPHALFLAAGVGSGYGWHGKRVLEFRTEQAVATGFSPGTLLQVTPELGYQYDERTAFALQLRYQFIPESGSGDTKMGNPKHGAWAALARGYRFFGTGNGQPFVTATVGGGQGFRMVVPPHPELGVTRNDTIRGGPVVLGPGAGYLFNFNRHLGWVAEVRLLAGVPDFALLAEFATGGQVSF
jgi:hypothetical protein